MVKIILAIFFDSPLLTLRTLSADFIGELPDLFLVLMAFDPVLAPLELCALLFELDNLWAQWQACVHLLEHHVRGLRIAREADVRGQPEQLTLLLFLEESAQGYSGKLDRMSHTEGHGVSFGRGQSLVRPLKNEPSQ